MKILNFIFDFLTGEKRFANYIWGKTDKGMVREKNEDAMIVNPEKMIFAVADGIGGHNAGDVASQNLTKSIDDFFSTGLLKDIKGNADKIKENMTNSILTAHQQITQMAKSNREYQGMGCTIVLAVVDYSALHVCHVGDSRAYMSNASGVSLLTTDHTRVMELVKAGMMTMEESRHTPIKNELSQSVGASPMVSPDYSLHHLKPGDKLLLCSDGLWDMLSDEQIHQILCQPKGAKHLCEELIAQANSAGGNDNITAVVYHHIGGSSGKKDKRQGV